MVKLFNESQKADSMSHSCQMCLSYEPVQSTDSIFFVDDVRVHLFCLLFSSGLAQTGAESEGIGGFKVADIKRELKRGSRLKCAFCRRMGATVGCAQPRCQKNYHLACGINNKVLNQYYGHFMSFCRNHRPTQQVKKLPPKSEMELTDSGKHVGETLCGVCHEAVKPKVNTGTLWGPCCGDFFHRSCMDDFAILSSLKTIRCPTCNNHSLFRQEMWRMGIFIPEKYSYSHDDKISQKLSDQRRRICHAKVCLCPEADGRSHKDDHGLWQVLVCDVCDLKGAHAKCVGFKDGEKSLNWLCLDCDPRVYDSEEEVVFEVEVEDTYSSDSSRHSTDLKSSDNESFATVSLQEDTTLFMTDFEEEDVSEVGSVQDLSSSENLPENDARYEVLPVEDGIFVTPSKETIAEENWMTPRMLEASRLLNFFSKEEVIFSPVKTYEQGSEAQQTTGYLAAEDPHQPLPSGIRRHLGFCNANDNSFNNNHSSKLTKDDIPEANSQDSSDEVTQAAIILLLLKENARQVLTSRAAPANV